MSVKNGIHWKRAWDKSVLYFWKLDNTKSKEFKDRAECTMDYITHYIDRYPKYRTLVEGKTWEQIFKMFNV